MSKQTIIIKPVQGISINSVLVGTYPAPDTKQPRTLLDNRTVVTGPISQNQKVFKHAFSQHRPVLKMEWDWSDKNNRNINAQRAEKVFWMEHPHVRVVGHKNTNLTQEMFEMTILEDLELHNFETWKKKLEAANIINNYNHPDRENVCFYFGGNPIGMSREGLLLELANYGSGRIMSGENLDKFLQFAKNPKSVETITRIVIKKAILLGIIVTNANKFYTPSGELLGNTEEDCVSYYLNKKDEFEFIKRSVSGKDNEVVDEEFQAKKAESMSNLGEVSDDVATIRDTAKRLGIAGWFNKSVDYLKEEIKKRSSN